MVQAERTGRGPPLVLLHGWALNLRVFDALVPGLQTTHSVIRFDLPGHGRSPWVARAATLPGHATLLHDALVRELDVQAPYTLVGWSLGGQIALEVAASWPRDVHRLVLIATSPRYIRCADWPHGASRATLEGLAADLTCDWRSAVGAFLELQVRGSVGSEQVLRDLRSALASRGEPDPAALEAGLDLLATTDLREQLGTIAQHALVVAGQYDRITPPGACRALAERLRHGRYAEVRRAGHAPFLSHPGEVARLVLEFLQ